MDLNVRNNINIDFYSFLIFGIILLNNIILSIFIYPKFSFVSNLFGIILYTIQVTLHIFLLLVNPGIPNRKFYISEGVMQSILTYLEYTNSETFDKYKICKICNIYVTPDNIVTHCEDCNICIQSK